jgi:iron complex outermembrane receptor protein
MLPAKILTPNPINCMPLNRKPKISELLGRACLVALPFLFPGIAFGQTTSTPQKDDETLVLSPFSVQASGDVGYRANTSITGTRIATDLDKLPLSVDVMTEDLIDDAYLIKVEDVSKYVAGVGLILANQGDTESFNIRGFSTSTVLRNGVRFQTMTDTSNISRIEVAKGPAAILYGVTEPGGIINYVTKRPISSSMFELKQSFGPNNYYRTEADINFPLDKKKHLLFRLSGSYLDRDSWRLNDSENQLFLNPVLEFRPTENTVLTADYSRKNRTGTFSRGGIPVLYGPARFAGATTFPMIFGFETGVISDDLGTALKNDSLDLKRSVLELRAQHTFNDSFSFQAVYVESALDYDSYAAFLTFMRTEPYANVFIPPAEGIELQRFFFREQIKTRDQYGELNFLAKFKTGPLQHSMVLGAQVSRYRHDTGQFTYSSNLDISVSYRGLNDPLVYVNTAISPEAKATYAPWFGFGNGTTQWAKPDFFVTDQISGWNNRFNALLGYRRLMLKSIGSEAKNVPQIGAIFALTPNISPYFVYSKSYKDNGYRDFPAPPPFVPRATENSSGGDIGLKFNFMDGALVGSACYFQIEKSNLTVNNFNRLEPFTGNIIGDSFLTIGKAKSEGFELSVNYRASRNLDFIASFADINARITSGIAPNVPGSELPGAVPQSAAFWGRYKFVESRLSGLTIGGGFRWVKGPIHFAPKGDQFYALAQTDSYCPIDLFARYERKWGKHEMAVAINGQNVNGERYVDRTLERSPPPQYFLSLEFKY